MANKEEELLVGKDEMERLRQTLDDLQNQLQIREDEIQIHTREIARLRQMLKVSQLFDIIMSFYIFFYF